MMIYCIKGYTLDLRTLNLNCISYNYDLFTITITFTTRLPYNPELSTVLNRLQDIIPSRLTFTNLPKFQEKLDKLYEKISIPSFNNSNIVLSIFSPCASGRADESPRSRPYIATASDTIVVNVEYRVVPVYLVPKAIYTSTDSSRFGINKARILIAGCSAGGGLAAGVLLIVRDHTLASARVCIIGLVLISSMLDNCVDKELANTESNKLVVPRRTQDISSLLRIYLDISSQIGAFYEFDIFALNAALSLKSITARTD
ncbi:alpha/beta hydrolase domain protein [Xylariaceae sp. FL0255]|nr:alpha/beta hydrolase domain protein [Xylariaceae sp. FL0255]